MQVCGHCGPAARACSASTPRAASRAALKAVGHRVQAAWVCSAPTFRSAMKVFGPCAPAAPACSISKLRAASRAPSRQVPLDRRLSVRTLLSGERLQLDRRLSEGTLRAGKRPRSQQAPLDRRLFVRTLRGPIRRLRPASGRLRGYCAVPSRTRKPGWYCSARRRRGPAGGSPALWRPRQVLCGACPAAGQLWR